MLRSWISSVPLILWLGVFANLTWAEVPVGGAEAGGVRFRLVRAANGTGPAWLESDVEILARPAADSPAGQVARVKVRLTVATETEAGGARHFSFFRCSAEAVALAAGRSSVRFYLPPEIVARDAVRGELRFWRVEVSTAAQGATEPRSTYAPALTTADSRRNFTNQAETGATANDGLLVPQYLTPFATEYPQSTPTFVRAERSG